MLNKNHRLDIDGLRAVAVLSVIAYHLNSSWLSGGFVGVDIFFVISGYVITSQILRLSYDNNFSLLAFYERRCRRILPAIYFLLLATSTFAILTLYPSEYKSFFSATKKVLMLMPNYYFAKNVNYFEADFETSPLLHTWSLGVEEQLYLVYPLIFIVSLRKFSINKNTILMLAALITSLLYSQHLISVSQAKAFYMTYSRAWEFLIGAIIALNTIPKTHNKIINHSLSISGAFLILYAFIYFDSSTVFPGLNALYPCLGAALIIYAGDHKNNFVSQFLSIKPMAFIGALSYSLYLWHWPIIAFYTLITHQKPTTNVTILIFMATFFFAYISWRCIEQPFRNLSLAEHNHFTKLLPNLKNQDGLKKIQVLTVAIVVSSLLFTSARHLGKANDANWRLYKVDTMANEDKEQFKDFVINNKDYQGVLFGDSHAMHYYKAVSFWAANHGLKVNLLSYPGCPSIFGEFPLT